MGCGCGAPRLCVQVRVHTCRSWAHTGGVAVAWAGVWVTCSETSSRAACPLPRRCLWVRPQDLARRPRLRSALRSPFCPASVVSVDVVAFPCGCWCRCLCGFAQVFHGLVCGVLEVCTYSGYNPCHPPLCFLYQQGLVRVKGFRRKEVRCLRLCFSCSVYKPPPQPQPLRLPSAPSSGGEGGSGSLPGRGRCLPGSPAPLLKPTGRLGEGVLRPRLSVRLVSAPHAAHGSAALPQLSGPGPCPSEGCRLSVSFLTGTPLVCWGKGGGMRGP